jgi:multiple sugar transport system permease protein
MGGAPRDLEGGGLVDGCTRLQVYRRIVLPMSGPGLVASGAITFMLCWQGLTAGWVKG